MKRIDEALESKFSHTPTPCFLMSVISFSASYYFNFHGANFEFKLMSKLNCDAAATGSHDFDNGVDGLSTHMPSLDRYRQPIALPTTVMEGFVKPFKTFGQWDKN